MQGKKTIIDLESGILILKKRGVKVSRVDIVKNHSVTDPTLRQWNNESPVTVDLMNYCVKNSKKDFPDIMKNLKGRDKALDFILDFCNETGLTFQELVKEV